MIISGFKQSETEKAILLENGNYQCWIPNYVINNSLYFDYQSENSKLVVLDLVNFYPEWKKIDIRKVTLTLLILELFPDYAKVVDLKDNKKFFIGMKKIETQVNDFTFENLFSIGEDWVTAKPIITVDLTKEYIKYVDRKKRILSENEIPLIMFDLSIIKRSKKFSLRKRMLLELNVLKHQINLNNSQHFTKESICQILGLSPHLTYDKCIACNSKDPEIDNIICRECSSLLEVSDNKFELLFTNKFKSMLPDYPLLDPLEIEFSTSGIRYKNRRVDYFKKRKIKF